MRLMKKNEDGAVRFLIAVDNGKENILYNTTVTEPGKRYMHFPMEPRAGYDLEYFRGLLSEKQIVKRKAGQNVLSWEKIYERNEPLDCRNYARACYRYFNWNFDKAERMLRGEDMEPVMTKAAADKKKPRRVISKGIVV